jgi:hypothetical protein
MCRLDDWRVEVSKKISLEAKKAKKTRTDDQVLVSFKSPLCSNPNRSIANRNRGNIVEIRVPISYKMEEGGY